jgi:hypothetical protein
MTAQSDIEELIHRADAEYRTVERGKRAEFAGVTAMTGLTILARHIDTLVERLDRLEPRRGFEEAAPGPEAGADTP